MANSMPVHRYMASLFLHRVGKPLRTLPELAVGLQTCQHVKDRCNTHTHTQTWRLQQVITVQRNMLKSRSSRHVRNSWLPWALLPKLKTHWLKSVGQWS